MSYQYLDSDQQEELECKMEKYPAKADSLLAKANEESQKIYDRYSKCWDLCKNLKPTTFEHEWFINQLERCLHSAANDFMSKNCDDFEMGLKLMNLYLDYVKTRNFFDEM